MLRIIEGFDHKSTTAKFSAKGWTITPTGGGSVSLIAGLLSLGQALRFTIASSNSSAGTAVKSLPAAYTGFVVGIAFRKSVNPASATSDVLIMRAAATNTFRVGIDATGHIVVRNSGGTVVATGATVLNNNQRHFIEAKVVINGASGSVEVQLNGATEISVTTGNFGSTGVDNIVLNAPTGTTVLIDFDDVYVLDTASSPNNTFTGDARVETSLPNADGAHSDFTPDSGSAHFSRVNEATGTFPDDDTSYVSDATVGHRDSYAFDNLPSLTGTVFGLQTVLYARKDDAALRQIAAVARPGSTDRDGATVTLSTTYADFTEIRETNPDTGLPWTISEINACEFGVKLVA